MTLSEFKSAINKGDILVKFKADWCGPCKIMSPVIEKIAKTHGLGLLTVDIDESPEITQEMKVKSIPYVMLFKNGSLLSEVVGATPLAQTTTALGLSQ